MQKRTANRHTTSKGQNIRLFLPVGCLAYCSIYICRLNFSVASAALAENGILTTAQIGIIGSIFSFIYALSKVPSGLLGDRKSARNVVAVGLLLTGSSNLLIALLQSFNAIAVLWGINAFGQAMIWGPLLRIFLDNFGRDVLHRVAPILSSTVAFGSVLGLLCAGVTLRIMNVRFCFLFPGIIAVLMAVLVWFFMPETPGAPDCPGSSIPGNIKRIITGKRFLRNIFPVFAHGIVKDNINVWLALYIVNTYHTDISSVGFYVFFVPLFSIAGKLLYPVLQKSLKKDRLIVAVCFVVCSVCSLILCLNTSSMFLSITALGVIAAGTAAINTYYLAVFPAEIADGANISFSASVMDLLTYSGAGIGSLVFGSLISGSGFKAMFLIWCLVLIVSAIVTEAVRS